MAATRAAPTIDLAPSCPSMFTLTRPGEFASASVGYEHASGVKTNDLLVCWGEQARGVTQADFPETE